MPSARGALIGTIIIGLAVGATLQSNITSILSNYTGEDRNKQAIVTGDLHFATDGTTTPSIILNGTDVLSVDSTTLDLQINGVSTLNPKRVAMAAPAKNVYQYIAASENPETGTATLLTFAVVCGNVPTAVTADIVRSLTSTGSTSASGTILYNDMGLSTGASLVYSGTTLQMGPVEYLKIISASGAITRGTPDCEIVPYWLQH